MVDLSSSLCKRLPEGIYLLFWKYLSTLKNRKTVHPSIQSTQQSIQGSFNPSEKYDCHLGLLFPIYGKPCSKPQKNRINLSIYLIHLAALDILNQLCFHGYWRYVGLIHWHNWGELIHLNDSWHEPHSSDHYCTIVGSHPTLAGWTLKPFASCFTDLYSPFFWPKNHSDSIAVGSRPILMTCNPSVIFGPQIPRQSDSVSTSDPSDSTTFFSVDGRRYTRRIPQGSKWGPRAYKIAKLVNITPITMIYDAL